MKHLRPNSYARDGGGPLGFLMGLGYGGVLTIIAWPVLRQTSGRTYDGALLAVAVATAILAAVMSRESSFWLEDGVILHKSGRKIARVEVRRLVAIKRSWIPRKGDVLLLEHAGGRMLLNDVGPATDAFRFELGRVVVRLGRLGHLGIDADPKTQRLLGLGSSENVG